MFDGETAVGWCEYGTPEELPGTFHRKDVESAGMPSPDYRLTCFVVDGRYRRRGVATAALDGALKLIADAGGGVVETHPQDTAGEKVSASFLYNATRTMFERADFTYERPKGKNHLKAGVVSRSSGRGWVRLRTLPCAGVEACPDEPEDLAVNGPGVRPPACSPTGSTSSGWKT